jgi:hypothetical protein
LKGILSANHCFPGGERLILFQIGLFSSVEETRVSLQRQPSLVDAGGSRTLLPCEELVFKGILLAS